MAVIFESMEMPKSCGGCKMSATDVCTKWLGLKRYELGSKRAVDCPLKEVPTGKWGKEGECPFCGYLQQWNDDAYCGHCGAYLGEEQQGEKGIHDR